MQWVLRLHQRQHLGALGIENSSFPPFHPSTPHSLLFTNHQPNAGLSLNLVACLLQRRLSIFVRVLHAH